MTGDARDVSTTIGEDLTDEDDPAGSKDAGGGEEGRTGQSSLHGDEERKCWMAAPCIGGAPSGH